MAVNGFHINFGTLHDLTNEARVVLKTGKGHAEPSAMFSDLDDFMIFMFPIKFLLLMMIRAMNPASMYELAQIVGRSQSGVLRDCKELEAMGFINLKREGPRKSLRPSLSFDYDCLILHPKAGESLHTLSLEV